MKDFGICFWQTQDRLLVIKDGITITAINPGRWVPFFYLVEEGKVARYKGGGYMGTETGTLTKDVKYILGGEYDPYSNSPYTPPDLTKVTHIMFEFAREILLVKNPLYEGGK